MASGLEVAYFEDVCDDLSRQLKAKDPEPTTCPFYAFLTIQANADVAKYHYKAMPVIFDDG